MRRAGTCGFLSLLLCASTATAAEAQNVITTVAGTEWLFPANVPAAEAPFGRIYGIFPRATGQLLVADADNHMIMSISDEVVTVIAGNGLHGYSGDGGPGLDARLNFPNGVTADVAGNIYIADSMNHRVRKITTDGIITTIAGTGQRGYSGDGGPATAAQIDYPCAVAVDNVGRVYIADTGNARIRRISTDGTIVTIAGTGQPGFGGDGGPATQAALNYPVGLVFDRNGNLYISDSLNHRIRVVSTEGTMRTAAGSGVPQSADGPALTATLGYPRQITFDSAGNLYITDPLGNKVRKLDTTGTVSTVAGYGPRDYSGDNGPATRAALGYPASVAFDQQGTLYIAEAENFRIRRVNSSGIISSFAGSGLFRVAADGVQSRNGYFFDLESIAVDAQGAIYFADASAHRVGRISPAGVMATIAGTGQYGYSGDGGPATQARLNTPVAVTLDSAGNLYIVDSGNQRIRRVTASGVIQTVVGDGTAGAKGDNGPALAASLSYPRGIAFDVTGHMYIADTQNDKVRRVTPAGIITTVAGSGRRGFSGDNGLAINASMTEPDSVFVDAAGNLYIGDISNHRIRKVTNGIITTVAGSGQTGDVSDGGDARSAGLNRPEDVAVDASGNIYIADPGNNKIRKVAPDGTISTIAGKGSRGFSGDGGTAAAAELNSPAALAIDSAGNLFIGDRGNYRIRAVLVSRPSFDVSNRSVTFSGNSEGMVAKAKIFISSSVPGVPFSIATDTADARWLSVDPATGFLPATVEMTADPTGVATGEYSAQLSITSPVASPGTLSMLVTFKVGPAEAPRLSVGRKSVALSLTPGSDAMTVQIPVSNAGGGELAFTTEATTLSGQEWLSVTAESTTIRATAPGSVTLTVDGSKLSAGTYSGTVRFRAVSTSDDISVPVYITVARSGPILVLSQAGLTFTAVTGGGRPLSQTVAILNNGTGAMNWSAVARTLSGGPDWLAISSRSGSVARAQFDTSSLDVVVNPGSLSPGEYYGQIQVSAATDNSPQSVSVLLRVLPADSPAGPDVQPAGMVFTGGQADTPGSQNIRIAVPGNRALSYTSAPVAAGGRPWFTHAPVTGRIEPGQPVRVVVQPDFAGLEPGIRRGAITFQFDDGSVRTVELLSVVATVQEGGQTAEKSTQRSVSGCTPRSLRIQITGLADNTAAVVGQPVTVGARVVDDCAEAVTNATPGASVSVTFSNGDPSGSMLHTQAGRWTHSWQPRSAGGSGSVLVTVTAFRALPNVRVIGDQITEAVRVTTGGSVPLIAPGAVLNGASFVESAPVAPGSIISVFGERLAEGDGQLASGTPLPTQLADTQVRLGDRTLPIIYASDKQLNLQVPYDLPANTQHQIIVQRGAALSVPEQVSVAAAQPAIFTQDQTGRGQGAILTASNTLADSESPARIGDTIVIYCAGLGLVDPLVPAGTAATGLTNVINPVTVTIGGVEAAISYAGLTPGFPGLYQINAVVPQGVQTGNDVPVVITSAGQSSPSVVMAVR